MIASRPKPPPFWKDPFIWKGSVAVFGVWLLSAFLVRLFASSEDKAGVMGDRFGAVNALFTGLAFLGVLRSLQLQRQQNEMQSDELALQRGELAAQREELANSVAAQVAMAEGIRRQVEAAAIAAEIGVISKFCEDLASQLNEWPRARGSFPLSPPVNPLNADKLQLGEVEKRLRRSAEVEHLPDLRRQEGLAVADRIQQLIQQKTTLDSLLVQLRQLRADPGSPPITFE